MIPQRSYVQLFEFGYVISKCSVADVPYAKVSLDAFNYLKRLALSNDETSNNLRLKGKAGVEVIQFLNYAGVIVTPDGTHIEVLPKIAKHNAQQDSASDSRAALLNMLGALGDFRYIRSDTADVMQHEMPLLEIFIFQFLSTVNDLVKRGISREYSELSDNLLFLKGKLNISEQLKRNSVTKHRFYITYDEYLPNTLPNQILKTALHKVLRMTQSAKSQRLARELEFTFAEVRRLSVKSIPPLETLSNRGTSHYREPLAWAKLIIEGNSPLSMQGNTAAFSLLFPLEAVFESYVEQTLRFCLPTTFRVQGQTRLESLATYHETRMFNLRPDIAIYKQETMVLVLDTKWKLIDASKANGSEKFDLSQADFYQMFAYGHKYLNGSGELVLIYPSHELFNEPLPQPFVFSHKLRLWVVPFDVHHQTADDLRLFLPEQLQHQLEPTSINVGLAV